MIQTRGPCRHPTFATHGDDVIGSSSAGGSSMGEHIVAGAWQVVGVAFLFLLSATRF
jgi:hypothetical protein